MLYGKFCHLRPLQDGDAPSLARHADNRKIWRNLRDSFPNPYTTADAQRFIEHAAEAGSVHNPLGICVDGEIAGVIGLHPQVGEFRFTGEFGYWLGEAYWGRGVMTEAVGLAVDHWFAVYDFRRVQAWAYTWNPASRRVLEKNGFTLEGETRDEVYKDGAYIGRWLFARLRPGI